MQQDQGSRLRVFQTVGLEEGIRRCYGRKIGIDGIGIGHPGELQARLIVAEVDDVALGPSDEMRDDQQQQKNAGKQAPAAFLFLQNFRRGILVTFGAHAAWVTRCF